MEKHHAEGVETVHSEDSPVRERPSSRHRLGSFLKRFWWLLLLVGAILALIIVLPIIYVGFPHQAQEDVNDSTLDIQSLDFSNPTPTSFDLTQHAILYNNKSYHPRLDAFKAALFLENTEPNIQPFAYVELPQVVSTAAAPVDFNQTINIVNADQFAAYTALALASEEYRLAIRGRTNLHQGSLPTIGVDYNEVVTLKGLNGLSGFNVTSFQIKVVPESDGSNLIGQVFIPNPSVMTLELGNVTFNLAVKGDPIGTAELENVVLVPGDNNFNMRATTDQPKVLTTLSQYPSGILPVDITGNSTIFNGQHLVYYEKALQASTLHVSLNIGAALASASS